VLEPLNLTYEVIDGIRAHSWKIEKGPSTPEGGVVRFADRIAYLAHDAEDALRAQVIDRNDFPEAAISTFGEPGRQWIQTMIAAVVDESLRRGELSMADSILGVMHDLRAFMFERVYLRPEIEPQTRRAKEVVRGLVEYYLAHPHEIPLTYRHDDSEVLVQVIDYVAGMTDRFAIRAHDSLFRPQLF
jgi:dGTPase